MCGDGPGQQADQHGWAVTSLDVTGLLASHSQDFSSPGSDNNTIIDFEKDSATGLPIQNVYETQRMVYQGAATGTPLRTTVTCCNGNGVSNPTSCYNTGMASPITRTTVFSYLPNSTGLQAETDSTYDQFGLGHEVDEYDYGSALDFFGVP